VSPGVPPAVVALRFSPDGSQLAAGCVDGLLGLLGQTDNLWTVRARCTFSEPPRALDFSSDGLFLRACGLADLCVYQLPSEGGPGGLKEVLGPLSERPLSPDNPPPVLELLRQLLWASQSCPLAWDSLGCRALKPSGTLLSLSVDLTSL